MAERDQRARNTVSAGRADEIKRTFETALNNLGPAEAVHLGWMAVGRMTGAIEDGALRADPQEFRAVTLVAACQDAAIMCGSNPALVASMGVIPPDGPGIDDISRRISRGASELAASGVADQALIHKVVPAALDGLDRFGPDHERLVSHIALYFVLAVMSGVGSNPPTMEDVALASLLVPGA